MKRIQLLSTALLVLVIASSTVSAQSDRDGTIYSRFGLGELMPFYSSKSQAMGRAGIGMGSGSFTNLANPSSLSDQFYTRVSGGFQMERVTTSNAANDESILTSGTLGGVLVSFPIQSNRLGVGLGFTPVSRVGYRVDVQRDLALGDDLNAGNTYRTSFVGNGGLDRVSLGVGYRLSPAWAFGARTDFVFGILEDVQLTEFADVRFSDTRLVRATRLRGFGLTLGGRFNLQSVLRDQDVLAIGATLTLPTALKGERVRTVGNVLAPDTLGTIEDGTVDLPWQIAAGVLYRADTRLTMVADILYEPWTSFESSFTFPGYISDADNGLSDRVRFGGGIEIYPAGRDLLASYLRQVTYRLGVFRELGYVSPDPGNRINSMGITGGISLPTIGGGTRVDINIEVGSRGTASGNLVQDRYVRFGVHLNFAERWFVRRRFL